MTRPSLAALATWLVDNRYRIPQGADLTLLALACHQVSIGERLPLSELERMAGVSAKSVRVHLTALRRIGAIEYESGDGHPGYCITRLGPESLQTP